MSIRERKFEVRVIIDQDDDLFHAYTFGIKGLYASDEANSGTRIGFMFGLQPAT
jgi:hypothetical protein